MCVRAEGGKVKSSARRALASSDFLYLSTLGATAVTARRQFEEFSAALAIELDLGGLPIVTREDFPLLLSRIYRSEKLAGSSSESSVEMKNTLLPLESVSS